MAEITGALSYSSFTLEVQVPVLTVERGVTAGDEAGPTVTVAECLHVPGLLSYYEEFLWSRPGEMTRDQFQAMLEDYVRLAILSQIGVETTPIIVGDPATEP
jgi:hypothetical protein